jgi:putative integral membrane protein (TIGR02587 family)
MSADRTATSSGARTTPHWSNEIDDALRGLASGILIGVPIVFTVDTWWIGEKSGPLDALAMLGVSYLLTLAAVHWIGFHRGRRHGWQYVFDALEALALAIIALVLVFGALGQLSDGQPSSVSLGRIAVALPPVSLGVAVANYLFARADLGAASDETDAAVPGGGALLQGWRLTARELGAALAGALFVCLAIVPGDELNDIATEVPFRNLSLVIALSILMSYIIVFAADFSGEPRRRTTSGPLQHPMVETLSAYVVGLAAALVSLLLFGHVDPDTARELILAKTVLLGFPAAVGAAAGRLAV